MNLYEEALEITKRLTLAQKVLLLEHLSTSLKEDMETEAYRHMPWEQYMALTYSSLADEPLERNQPMPDVRDEIS